MNGTKPLKPLRTVRLGDLLLDEKQRLQVLCRGCQRLFLKLDLLHDHITKCAGLKHIVSPSEPLTFEESKRKTRPLSSRQELHMYDIEAVNHPSRSIMDLVAELENPRWYNDDPGKGAKENVQAKERLQAPPEPDKSLTRRHQRPVRGTQTQRRKRSSLPAPQAPKQEKLVVPNVIEDLRRYHVSLDGLRRQAAPPSAPPKPKPMPKPSTPVKVKQIRTQEILDRLRTNGVQVRRGSTRLNPSPPREASGCSKEALAIMLKLQSKGIKCTKVKRRT
ncbi:hypothetical protein KR018_009883 [Drosophila ironensis]|nr:hypothetical protein KR018_009883 [Drosophila ironensis]